MPMSSIVGSAEFSIDDLNNVKEGEFLTLKIKAKKIVSRWMRGQTGEFDYKDIGVEFYVAGIYRNLAEDAVTVIGYYQTDNMWFHVNMVVSKDPEDKIASISIRPGFEPHKSIVLDYQRRQMV